MAASWRDAFLPVAAGLEALAAAAAMAGRDALASGLHAASCAVLAFALHRRPFDGSFVFALALFLPVVGLAGISLVARVRSGAANARAAELVRTPIPGAADALAAAERSPKALDTAPMSIRVAAARGRNDPGSIALLRRALADADEDVRLVAHAVLEAKSRTAYRDIHRAESALERATPESAGALHRRLANGYWELAWLGLAQGESLGPVLQKARHHALAALSGCEGHAGLQLLLGRIELKLGEAERAEAALAEAVRRGVPESVAAPYLAEAAFLRRAFDRVRRLLSPGAIPGSNPTLHRIARYWA